MNVMKALLVSRKFWLAILSIVVAATGDRLNINTTLVAGAVACIFANILGISIEDAAEKSNANNDNHSVDIAGSLDLPGEQESS